MDLHCNLLSAHSEANIYSNGASSNITGFKIEATEHGRQMYIYIFHFTQWQFDLNPEKAAPHPDSSYEKVTFLNDSVQNSLATRRMMRNVESKGGGRES